jgi:hypothetical protein
MEDLAIVVSSKMKPAPLVKFGVDPFLLNI